MSSTARQWLVPVAAALGVVALVIGTHWAVSGGSSAGAGPDRPARAIYVQLPTAKAGAITLTTRAATITGYRGTARNLTVYYTVTDLECVSMVVGAAVEESPTAVTLQLKRLPAPDTQLYSCPSAPIQETLQVRLATSLGTRVVVDAANAGAAVPDRGA
jgi:hypothetical protein